MVKEKLNSHHWPHGMQIEKVVIKESCTAHHSRKCTQFALKHMFFISLIIVSQNVCEVVQ